jgi:hypothetical protein
MSAPICRASNKAELRTSNIAGAAPHGDVPVNVSIIKIKGLTRGVIEERAA